MNAQPALARLAALVGVSLALASCASLVDGARDTFAKSQTCPPGRVSVVPRPGYEPPPSHPPPQPSPEVARDPERLRFWQQERARAAEEEARHDLHYDWFEVTGCGKHEMVGCTHHFQDDRGGTPIDPTHSNCFELAPTPAN